MNQQKIAVIGAGNMAEAMIAGMITNQFCKPEQLIVTNRGDTAKLQALEEAYGVFTSHHVEEVLNGANMIILSMKPKDMVAGLTTIRPYLQKDQLLISVIAGLSTERIQEILALDIPIIRAMPNTSATISQSATALCRSIRASQADLDLAIALFETIGTVSIVNEAGFHAVTGLSGSGPAYFYFLAEAMEQAASELGLDKTVAKGLIAQTIIGAGEMLKHSAKDAATLKKNVMSPGGTTEAGLHILADQNVQEAMINCIKRAAERSEEIGAELEKVIVK